MPDPSAPVTLRELFEAYRIRRLRNATDGTIRKFRASIAHFEQAIGRPATLADLNDIQFAEVLHLWMQNLQLSPHSLNGYGGKIACLWRFACRRGWLVQWPEPDWQLPAPRRSPRAWSREELAILFAALAKQPGWICGVPAAGWWLTLHHFLFDSGERIAAALSLRWEDVDLSTRWCLIRGENRKGKTADRAYLIHEDTATGMKAIELPRRELVFPLDVTMGALWLRYDKLLRKAGLDHSRTSKFHRMRRSVASYVAASQGRQQASEALGHADPRTTVESYLDCRICPPLSPSSVLFRPDRG